MIWLGLKAEKRSQIHLSSVVAQDCCSQQDQDSLSPAAAIPRCAVTQTKAEKEWSKKESGQGGNLIKSPPLEVQGGQCESCGTRTVQASKWLHFQLF